MLKPSDLDNILSDSTEETENVEVDGKSHHFAHLAVCTVVYELNFFQISTPLNPCCLVLKENVARSDSTIMKFIKFVSDSTIMKFIKFVIRFLEVKKKKKIVVKGEYFTPKTLLHP